MILYGEKETLPHRIAEHRKNIEMFTGCFGQILFSRTAAQGGLSHLVEIPESMDSRGVSPHHTTKESPARHRSPSDPTAGKTSILKSHR